MEVRLQRPNDTKDGGRLSLSCRQMISKTFHIDGFGEYPLGLVFLVNLTTSVHILEDSHRRISPFGGFLCVI